jgi:hypothetical protein
MPGSLIELGFHDSVADTNLQKNARFRAVAARAIYKGILRYWAPGSDVIPLPPDGLRLENLGGGQVRVSWDVVHDPLEPSASPTSFKVYVSRNGRGFDDGTEVPGTNGVITGLTDGDRIFVRVAALNAGGESLPGKVGGVKVGGAPAAALIVDGFDRPFWHSYDNIYGRYTGDYVVEHLDAFGPAISGGIDFSSNEAVIRGSLALDPYMMVDWFLGRESSVDHTFEAAEQTLVENYLRKGGTLFASGTEIAWDLEAKGGGVRFLNDVLGVRYVADDAKTYTVSAVPGGPFDGIGPFSFDDGTHGTYDTSYPDVLTPTGAGQDVLTYGSGGTSAAAVAVTSPYRVVVFGFPLETVTDPAVRRSLAARTVNFLLPGGTGGGSGGGGGSTGGSTGGTTIPGGTGGSTPGSTSTAQTGRRRSSGGGCAFVPGIPASSDFLAYLLLGLSLFLVRRLRRPYRAKRR